MRTRQDTLKEYLETMGVDWSDVRDTRESAVFISGRS